MVWKGNILMRYFLLSLVAVFLAASQVAGRGEFRLGGEDGTPWSAALGETAGEYLLFDSENSQIGALEVGTTPYGAGVDTLIDFSGTQRSRNPICGKWYLSYKLNLENLRSRSPTTLKGI